jgi:hypothetical protein
MQEDIGHVIKSFLFSLIALDYQSNSVDLAVV